MFCEAPQPGFERAGTSRTCSADMVTYARLSSSRDALEPQGETSSARART
jgi:hypothetical protein